MAIPRASAGLLRNHIRPAASQAKSPRGFATTQLRRRATSKDDLGGPGGQQPPPPNPGGPEAVKRNWIPIGGAALAAVAAYAYLTAPKSTIDKAKDSTRTEELNAIGEDAKDIGKKVGQQVSEQANKTMKEMSGRQKTEQGSFRHD
ncbi:hypothetical protein VFPPC_16310 [Pochonia chlamydosporia 170]|uniref:Uncharacterized protein n=1 Tax=Pochonia chlamydosporia 170 TaxID=1380566 RepID=A0A179FHY2_METCM|nr:hypothetical protein VFPPC_16310 [Pochonia chlamydosporia 170]OAQ65142.1 hypothetical protein VFPPC_16310 [Pochonia chlamydosporia 170]